MDKQHVELSAIQVMAKIATGEWDPEKPPLPAADVIVVDEHNEGGPAGMLFAIAWERCPATVKVAALNLRHAISQNPAQ